MDKAKDETQGLYNEYPNQVCVCDQVIPVVEPNWDPITGAENSKINNYLRCSLIGLHREVPK
jgi:hypothetical protein